MTRYSTLLSLLTHCLRSSGYVLALIAMTVSASPSRADDPAYSVLVFSKTVGYRHASIEAGVAAIRALGEQNGYGVDATEDASAFTDEHLALYRAVIFLNTTGDVLDLAQQSAFERFIQRGGGYVGVHSASDTEYEWPWYGALVGTYFRKHPAIQRAALNVVDASHVSTRHLPIRWIRTDEWYNFIRDLEPEIDVLIHIEERSYSGGSMGTGHPMAWCHRYDGGRAWYTALGHTIESYAEPLFLQHLQGGIAWAAGVAP